MYKKALISSLLCFLTLGNSVLPAEAAAELTLSIVEKVNGVPAYDSSYITTGVGSGSDSESLCSGWDDPKCKETLTAHVIFPVCKSTTQQNCVETLTVTSETVSGGTANLIRTITPLALPPGATNGGGLWQGDGNLAGAGWSLFEVSALSNAGEISKFAVKVRIDFYKQFGRFMIAGPLEAIVVPYLNGTTTYKDPSPFEVINSSGIKTISGLAGDPRCVWSENGACGIETSFPKGAKVKLSIRVGNYLVPWLHGRLAEPIIDMSEITPNQNRLTVEAAPLLVPSIKALIPVSENLKELQTAFCPFWESVNCLTDRSFFDNYTPVLVASQLGTFKRFIPLEKLIGNKATSIEQAWSFRSISPSVFDSPTEPERRPLDCMSRKYNVNISNLPQSDIQKKATEILQSATLYGTGQKTALGIISTNALTYEIAAPKFKDGYLNFNVASMHSNPDGSDFMGTYDLVLNGEFARCLFGIGEKVPVSATVSIVSNDTESKVQTTFFKDDGEWIRFGAYGFTFSAPTLKIKLFEVVATNPVTPADPVKSVVKDESQPVPKQEVTATNTTTTSAVKVKKTVTKSISCVKGKITKKVSGINPKCPIGFKKK
jgi:hypothetical protein